MKGKMADSKKCETNDGYKMTVVGLKEFFDAKLTALDRLLEVKFEAAKSSSDASFRSSEIALQKAAEAQSQFNQRTNEFRQSLSDCQTLLLSRSEFAILHGALEDKIEGLRADIAQLREFRSVEYSKDAQIADQRGQRHFGIETFLSILAVVIALVVLLLRFIH